MAKQNLALAIVVSIVLAIAVLIAIGRRSPRSSIPGTESDPASGTTPATQMQRELSFQDDAARLTRTADVEEEAGKDAATEREGRTLYPVDLDALQREIPDNLYWALGAPSDDPDILATRRAWQDEQERLKGLVVSGTGSRSDIEAYFDRRTRQSRDYVAFVERVLQQYGAELPEREVGLYELSRAMHKKRLEDLPAERERAYVRQAEQEKRREQWRARGE